MSGQEKPDPSETGAAVRQPHPLFVFPILQCRLYSLLLNDHHHDEREDTDSDQ
jgi:hypothetical protein